MKQMRAREILLWSALAMAGSPALAQQQALTLGDCVRLALEAPSAAQTAEREEAIAAERQTAARANLLPQFGVSSGYVYNSPLANGPNPFSFVALNGVREYLATADTNWNVDLSGRLRAGLSLARAGRDVAAADLAIARRDLRRAVTLAYYDLQLARQIVELEQLSLREAQEFERNVRARQEQGEVSRADLLKASAQRSQFEQRLAQARLNAKMANQILASFWTADADGELPLAESLEAPAEAAPAAPQEESREAILRRPEMNRLDALDRSYQAQRSIARAGLKPDANLIFQYGFDVNQVRADQRGYAAYVNMSVPVFDWFRARSGVREAQYRREQVRIDRAAAERTFSREYLAARARAESWRERIAMAESEYGDGRENLRLVRLLYAAGEGPALDVVASQVQAAQAGVAYYSAIAEYRRALADFEVAAGR
jgi:cobalt-zinc-cadmium efflux system outer membrane protein